MFSNINKRLPSGIILSALAVLAMFWAPGISLCVILITIAALALMEFYALLDACGIPNFRIVGVCGGSALIAGTWAAFVFKPLWVAEMESLILCAIVLYVMIRQFPQKHNAQPLATMACTLLGIFYVSFLLNFFTKLVFTWQTQCVLGAMNVTGRTLVLYLVAVVKLTDTGAYFVGSVLGHHKLIPRISPGKTWEGAVGGVLTGLAASLAIWWMLDGKFGVLTLRLADAVILGLLLPFLGTVGDLYESLIKRSTGAKDSSQAIPGMGGALDVLDSLLFTAPVLYIYAKWFLS